jgi:Cft2 family RNA processing exonuclease
MPLLLKFHGALDEVLGSCSFVRFKPSGRTYAIDCGLAQRHEVDAEPAFPGNLPEGCQIGALDGVFITHAHGDHIGALIRWLEAGFTGKIYCTAETSRLTLIACQDQAENDFGDDSRRLKKVLTLLKEALERFIPCVPGVSLEVEPGLHVECFPTSHMFGCVAFRFSADKGEGAATSVLFTGDIGPVEWADETGSMSPARSQPPASDYVVAESTYGNSPSRADSARSCARRLEKLAQVLERGLCEGASSKVIFPAFSLQRSHDLLLDVCHLLLFHRARLGLRDGLIPRVYLDSGLARDFIREYLAFYEEGLGAQNPFINDSAAFLQSAGGTREAGLALLRSILGFEYKGVPALLWSPAAQGGLPMEVCWGAPPDGALGPYVVICGKGATNGARIVHYLRSHVSDPGATFVLTGFVPPKSPGFYLRQIDAAKGEEERTKIKLRLPAGLGPDEGPQEIRATSVKSSFDDISPYYSGHADAYSVCRYVLGEDGSAASGLKGVFLVHGDREAREGLSSILKEDARNTRDEELRVHLPRFGQGWFDCEADDWVQPVSVDIGLSLNVPSELPPEEIHQLISAQFGIGRWSVGPDGSRLLEVAASSAKSLTRIEIKPHNEGYSRLVAKTTYSEFRRLADLGPVFFKWREVINAIGLDKQDYFAGHKFVRNDTHLAEFDQACLPHCDQGGQRVTGFIVAGKRAFSSPTLRDLEQLLTPHVRLFVFDTPLVSEKLNRAIFIKDPLSRLTADSAFYVPVRFAQPALELPRVLDAASIEALLKLIESDRELIEARSIAVPACSASAVPPETVDIRSGAGDADAVPKPGRKHLTREAYEGIYPHQELQFVIEKVSRRRSTGEILYVLLRRAGALATGILHRSNFGQDGFAPKPGATITAFVSKVDPEERSLELTLIKPVTEAKTPLSRAEEFGRRTGCLTWAEMAKELCVSFDVLRGLVSDHFKKLADGPADIQASGIIPAGYELRVFESLSVEIEAGMRRARSTPPEDEGFTYRKMALELGRDWNVDHVLDAAGFFASKEHSQMVGRMVLDANPSRSEDALFPLDKKEEFYALCHSASANGWKSVADVMSSEARPDMPEHSGYSLTELSTAWSIPADQLAKLAKAAQVEFSEDKFIGREEALRLRSVLTA